MSIRFCLLLSLVFPLASGLFAAAGDADIQNISLDKPVQVPEAVLQPGKYSIHLEGRLSDRAVVRITDSQGTDHYLLSVPSKSLSAAPKGLIFFPQTDQTQVLHGWQCADCQRPLEFVYPKDEAVKLTASTGKPILAYDPSYDKLPANLSAEDRKVVTLWLLTPKTVTPLGQGEGLTAAKYSAPRVMASAEPLPKRMPKTATTAFLELVAGFVSFMAGILVFVWRKVSALPKSWKMAGLTMMGGIVTGFALPIAVSYQTANAYATASVPKAAVLEIAPLQVVDRNSEVERLKARNRRLEAMVALLSHQQ